MTTSEKSKIVQYLNEAHATVAARRSELESGGNPIGTIVGLAQDAVGQALALAKTPLDLVRGSGGEEKVLKNAKDACATEALEIATYISLEELARALGDEQTADLAASIRADEEAMLERIQGQLPALTRAVVAADIEGNGSYDITKTGAADAARDAVEETKEAARSAGDSAKSTARRARRVPGVAQAEGAAKGAVASEEDLAIPGYDSLNADEIIERLSGLSQIDLAKIDAYERREIGRKTILERISSLRGDEPWPGYDDMNAQDVVERLRDADDALASSVRQYERAHKGRTTVLRAAERERTHA